MLCDSIVSSDGTVEWPVPETIGEPEDMPVQMLPAGPYREWIAGMAANRSLPVCAPATISMLGLMGLVGSRCGVKPYINQSFIAFANTNGGLVADPGQEKSPTIDAALAPIMEMNRALMQQRERDAAHRAARLDINDALIAEAKKNRDVAMLQYLYIKRSEIQAPGRRLILNDATVEALAEIMRGNPGGVILLRDELAGLFRMADREGSQGTREFWLEAWEGGRTYGQDRIRRGQVAIQSVTLSIIGGIQPAKLAAYVAECTSEKSEKNDGLLQRLQLVINMGRREWKFRDEAAEKHDAVWHIVELMDRWLPLPQHDPDTGAQNWEPLILGLSDAGYRFWSGWIEWWMNRVVRAEPDPAIAGHLSKYRKTHLGLALVFSILRAGGENPGVIDEPELRLAADWIEYMAIHARRMYGISDAGSPAERLAEAIQAGRIADGTSIRDLTRRKVLGRGTDTSKVRAAVAVLVDKGWVRLSGQNLRINPAVVPHQERAKHAAD